MSAKKIPAMVREIRPVDQDMVVWQATVQLLLPTAEIIDALSKAGLYRQMVDASIQLYGSQVVEGQDVDDATAEAMRDVAVLSVAAELAEMVERVDAEGYMSVVGPPPEGRA